MSVTGSGQGIGVESSVVLFPLERQRREVSDLARRLLRKRSVAAADKECSRVADAMFARLARLGLGEMEQDEAVGAFFHAVEQELAMLREARAGCACCAAEA